MKIGILGSGDEGCVLGAGFVAVGHEEAISHGAEKRLRPWVDSGWLACYTRPMD